MALRRLEITCWIDTDKNIIEMRQQLRNDLRNPNSDLGRALAPYGHTYHEQTSWLTVGNLLAGWKREQMLKAQEPVPRQVPLNSAASS